MNKKGFTLIELLAVIIILGILMIIAIPSVTRYINDSRKSTYVDSAKEIIAAARNFVNEGKVPMYDTSATYYIKASCIKTENGGKSPYGEFVDDETYVIVTYDGNGYDYYWVSRDTTGQGVPTPTALKDLDEDNIKSDIALGTIIPTKISDDKSNVQVINTTCNGFEIKKIDITSFATLPTGKTKKEDLVVGDLVTIGTEEFYVINNDTTNDKLTLLAHYNLNVGNYINPSVQEGIQHESIKGRASNSITYGTVAFSNSNYWSGNVGLGKEYQGEYSDPSFPYVFDSHSNIKQYIDNYKNYLIKKGAIIIEARLMNYMEAKELGCSITTENCRAGYAFFRNTSYWLGSVKNYGDVFDIRSDGNFDYRDYDFQRDDECGVRPVIVI